MTGDTDALLFPLDAICAAAQKKLPEIAQITGESMPQPCRSLLVHQSDMTPALEKFYGQPIHLRLLQAFRHNQFYLREVVLLLDGGNQAVEYGAIAINLDCFSAPAQAEVLAGKRPLGTILREQNIFHASLPRAYLQVAPDPAISSALQLAAPTTLYGRRNRLTVGDGAALAEIVEVLAATAVGS
jgi:chorismate-pyruvate lyase